MTINKIFPLCLIVFGGWGISVQAGQKLPQGASECFQAIQASGPAIVRRAAYVKLWHQYTNSERREALQSGLKDADPLIRSRAVLELYADDSETCSNKLIGMNGDPSPEVQASLRKIALRMKDSPDKEKLCRALQMDSKARTFNFFRINQRLCDNPNWDQEITVVKSLALPTDGWRFTTDPQDSGHTKGYMKEKFNDTGWSQIKVGYWEEQGFENYDGVAWYRLKFDMPPKPACNAAELLFEGVDEEAWVWLNGEYIGQHTLGPSGWNKPFALDVTREIRWDTSNTLIVRVFDSAKLGGIYKPVKIAILK